MRAVLQRVTGATVHVDGELISRIGPGIVALIGIGTEDTVEEIAPLTRKILCTRLWNEGVKASQIAVPPQYNVESAIEAANVVNTTSQTTAANDTTSTSTSVDEQQPPPRSEQVWGGKPWKSSVKEIEGEILCISQFTLHARLTKGTKPDFHKSMAGQEARTLYEALLQRLRADYRTDRIRDGAFGEMMQCSLTNDGPVTILVDTADRGK